MRKREIIENDPLEQLFAAAREEQLSTADFRQQVMSRFLIPPSRNMYRIPTFATAAASVLIIAWMSVSGFDASNFTERFSNIGDRIAQHNAKSGIRLIPQAWTMQRKIDNSK